MILGSLLFIVYLNCVVGIRLVYCYIVFGLRD